MMLRLPSNSIQQLHPIQCTFLSVQSLSSPSSTALGMPATDAVQGPPLLHQLGPVESHASVAVSVRVYVGSMGIVAQYLSTKTKNINGNTTLVKQVLKTTLQVVFSTRNCHYQNCFDICDCKQACAGARRNKTCELLSPFPLHQL